MKRGAARARGVSGSALGGRASAGSTDASSAGASAITTVADTESTTAGDGGTAFREQSQGVGTPDPSSVPPQQAIGGPAWQGEAA